MSYYVVEWDTSNGFNSAALSSLVLDDDDLLLEQQVLTACLFLTNTNNACSNTGHKLSVIASPGTRKHATVYFGIFRYTLQNRALLGSNASNELNFVRMRERPTVAHEHPCTRWKMFQVNLCKNRNAFYIRKCAKRNVVVLVFPILFGAGVTFLTM